jgi:tape measure domain-containing protein
MNVEISRMEAHIAVQISQVIVSGKFHGDEAAEILLNASPKFLTNLARSVGCERSDLREVSRAGLVDSKHLCQALAMLVLG